MSLGMHTWVRKELSVKAEMVSYDLLIAMSECYLHNIKQNYPLMYTLKRFEV